MHDTDSGFIGCEEIALGEKTGFGRVIKTGGIGDGFGEGIQATGDI